MFCGERILILSKSRKIMSSEQILGTSSFGNFLWKAKRFRDKRFFVIFRYKIE